MAEEYLTIDDNESTKAYFNRFIHIGRMLEKISEKEAGLDESSVDDHIILSHIKKLNKTLAALQAKYWFNGLMKHRQQSILMIDSIDSGFPLSKEVREMAAEKKKAEYFLSRLPSEERIKESILDTAIGQKRINIDRQYDLSMRMYYQLLIDNDLFMPENQPEFILGSDAKNGNKRYIVHWSVYDSKKNIPNIYVMMFEYSGRGNLEENSNVMDKLPETLINNSMSTLKLLNIGMNIDKEFEQIHPKNIKRVHVGPVYKNGTTQHNDEIQSILDDVVDDKNNWVFGWSVETLLSRGTQLSKTGLFGHKQEEVFYVDSNEYEAFDAGATDIDRSMILPYEVYQTLADAKDNPLNNFNKYVVNNDGEVIFL